MQFLVFLSFAALAFASHLTWTGQGANNLWDNYANWEPAGIPTMADECTIGIPGTVLIGTSNGAQCNSLSIADGVALTVAGASANFGQGGVSIVGKSSLLVNAGAGTFNAAKATFQDATTFTWTSGQVSGNFVFGIKTLVTINANRGFATCLSGDWTNQGTLNILGGTQFNSSCKVENAGAINVQSADFPTYLWQLFVSPKSTGSVNFQGIVQAKIITLNKVTISGTLAIQPGGLAALDDVVITQTSSLTTAEPSATTINSKLACAGSIYVNGLSSVTVNTNATVGVLQLNNGKATFAGSVQFGSIEGTGGALTLGQDATANSISSTDLCQFLGTGTLTAQQATFGKYVKIATPVVITKSVVVSTLQLTLDSSFTLQQNGVLTVGGVQGFWGPSDPTKPGSFRNDGTVIASKPGLTMNSLVLPGRGPFWLQDAVVDFQNLELTTSEIHLNASTSVLKGESFKVSYDALFGPRAGSSLGVLVNSVYSTCASPCTAFHSQFPVQSFWVKVATA